MKILLSSILFVLISISVYSQENDVQKELNNFVKTKKLSQNDIQNFKITDYSKSKLSNAKYIYYRQAYNEVEIVGTESNLIKASNGQVISSSNQFVQNLSEKLINQSHQKTASSIVAIVAQKMGYTFQNALKIVDKKENTTILSDGGISKYEIPVKKIYYAEKHGKVKSAWELSIKEIEGVNWFNFFVDDSSGEIILQNNWTIECNHEHDKTNHNHPNNATSLKVLKPTKNKDSEKSMVFSSGYNVFQLPLESPLYGSRSLVLDPENLDASPFGWHDTDGIDGEEYTVTRGNNVNAYEDGDNFGYQPDGGPSLTFDFPFNPIYSASDQSEDAAITNLFYWNNIAHDIFHQYGFDEDSGNFQENNYSGLGIANDQVLAESQDNFGTCNANFQTPPDGTSGIMQMYVCNQRDGSFDNQVMIHEYGHGVSVRLTGGASNSDCLFNDEQMGEGWSDWYGTMLTMTSSDLSTDLRPVGNWLFGQDINGLGIRDFPYTTDITQDPRTYDFIQNTFGPHPLGSTWAAMLWEVTWELIDEYGFDDDFYTGTGGNNIALALVTEALKIQPCNPGFVDGRDAILAADQLLYGGQNQCRIWDAFAKRGLGFSATQGSSFSRTDGSEAFDLPTTTLSTPDVEYCLTDNSIILDGGLPIGGVYSGPGVTDNGDGLTYTFDPAIAGIGSSTITYTASSLCATNGDANAIIIVKDANPIIECTDIEISLGDDGTVSILPQDIILNYILGDDYSIDQTGTFDPQDITSTGTSVQLFDDQVSSDIPVGFDFSFFGTEYSSFRISSNGFITFNNNTNSGCCSGQTLPNTNTPNNLIALAWTDLNPSNSGSIKYETIGTAPNRVLIVDFTGVPLFGSFSQVITSQIKLFENNAHIEIHSANISGFGITQGIENSDGSDFRVVPGRNTNSVDITNDFVSFVPQADGFPDNCGLETTATLDFDTFDCSNLGDNTITATLTDSDGNSSTCTATVSILPNDDIAFDISENTFCDDQTIQTDLSGGFPIGGVYSGTGVTDDGNGDTFSFDPNLVGIGTHDLIYTISNSCGTSTSVTTQVEVQAGVPQIECQDISVELGADGTITFDPEELIFTDANSLNSLYALTNNFSGIGNIAKYDFNTTEDINFDEDYIGSSQFNTNYAIENDPTDNTIYILASNGSFNPRNLYTYNVDDNSSQLIGTISSVNGNTRPQAMAFDNNGVLYFYFENGELNSFDVDTQIISPLSSVFNNGAVGLTFDFDNNRLIHSTGFGSFTLTEINITSGVSNTLFSASSPDFTFCGAQAISYIGDGIIIASSSQGCDAIYTIDLNTEETNLLLSPTQSFSSIQDLMLISNLPVDNCSGEPLTFSVDQNTFDCNNLGDNTITLTATDNNGNTSSCTATVTVVPNDDIEFNISQNIFCVDETLQTGLSGGLPTGGVYSGTGVTDDGNGDTFSFDPSVAGVGNFDITYTITNTCSSLSTDAQVEVQSAIPQIECQDINIQLGTDGTVTLNPEDLISNSSSSGSEFSLYALGLNAIQSANIALYEYDNINQAVSLEDGSFAGTNFNNSFAIEFNNNDGNVYILAGTSSSSRSLFTYNLEDSTSQLIGSINSVNGNNRPQAMAFDNNGILYFAFQSGEINSYDVSTQTISPLSTVTNNGAVGLTFDFDNNRLIHSTASFILTEIDITSGISNTLFSASSPDFTFCGAQAISYLGDGTIIASSTSGCDAIYTIDLNTEETSLLLSPTQSFSSIKDLMLISNLPVDNCSGEPLTFSVDQGTFDCSDLGDNTITLTATDSNGNTSPCTATVTITESNSEDFVLDCVSDYTLNLDATGQAELDYTDLLISAPTTTGCGSIIEYSISQNLFDCSDYSDSNPLELIENGSFESELNTWVTSIENGSDSGGCIQGWKRLINSTTICCCVPEVFPTDGNFGIFTSFDGNAGMSYILEQTFNVPFSSNDNINAILSFDWVAEFDLTFGSSLPRVFVVELYDENDNLVASVYSQEILNGVTTSINDSLSFDVSNTLENYQGENLTLKFSTEIPESSSGPAKAMIDNVSLIADSSVLNIEITAADENANVLDTCFVPVTLQDPFDFCDLSVNDTILNNNFSFYPNSATNNIHLEWSNIVVKKIEIFDINGKSILRDNTANNGTNKTIDVSSLATGVYLLVVKSDYGWITKKLIKQ